MPGRKAKASRKLRKSGRRIREKIEYLWAPWRLSYILDPEDGPLSAKERSCVFCRHVETTDESPDDDRRSLILDRGRSCYTILNKYPYANGHLMVIPFEHIGDFQKLQAPVLQEMMTMAQKSARILSAELGAAGFNLGMNLGRAAGAGIPGHLHIHVVPRWVGDSNFMPIIGHTRVLPEYIERTYDRLVDAFRKK